MTETRKQLQEILDSFSEVINLKFLQTGSINV